MFSWQKRSTWNHTVKLFPQHPFSMLFRTDDCKTSANNAMAAATHFIIPFGISKEGSSKLAAEPTSS